MDILKLIFGAIWFILPAYTANMFPVFVAKTKFAKKYNKPVDFGIKYGRKQLFGAGKTWLGLIFGIIAGSIIGFLQGTLILGILLASGALIGDLVGSFVKRRFGLERGERAILLDQLDFLIGAFIFSSVIMEINYSYFLVLVFLTPSVHLLANYLGYKLGLKKEPW